MGDNKKDEGMEKFGVQFEDKVKVAEELIFQGLCPWCKATLDSLDPPYCPKHGTEPFEAKK